jgi:hypothetical protein
VQRKRREGACKESQEDAELKPHLLRAGPALLRGKNQFAPTASRISDSSMSKFA